MRVLTGGLRPLLTITVDQLQYPPLENWCLPDHVLIRQVTGNSVPVAATLVATKSETVLAAVVGLFEMSFMKYAIDSLVNREG